MVHNDRDLTEARIDRFVRERLQPAVHGPGLQVAVERWDAPDEPVGFAAATRQEFRRTRAGASWGPPWSTMWLRVAGQVPEEFGATSGLEPELLVDLGFADGRPGFQAEALAWRPDGTVVKSISSHDRCIPLRQLGSALSGGRFVLYIEAAANPDFRQTDDLRPDPNGDLSTADREPLYRLGEIILAERRTEVAGLLADTLALSGLMHELAADQPRSHHLMRALDDMIAAVDPKDVAGTASAGRTVLFTVLSAPAVASAHTLIATGQTHIATAGLWPVRETIRKCARAFSSVAALAESHPDFVFACSQAQQLAWIKDDYPDLFLRLQRLAGKGQFVPVGGMWVEADTNLPGGEAMARQFLQGKQFFANEFGVDCREVWLPDSFGYSAGLPGVFVAAGMRWFLTQQNSPSLCARMPHNTFWWEGIDGSRIFTHFPPAGCGCCEVTSAELAHAERTFADHSRASVSLLPYGYGDGGGPTREMLEAAARAADLEGSPRVVLGSPKDFFTRAQAEQPEAPVWLGEIYPEAHRGTLTTQANIKRGNRRNEHLLREAELWAATATVNTGIPYPARQLRHCWRTVLLQQFRDILAGGSIAWVNADAERAYAAVEEELEELIADSLAALVEEGEDELVANSAPHPRAGVPALGIAAPPTKPGPRRKRLPAKARLNPPRAVPGTITLRNEHLIAVVDTTGELVSLIDMTTSRESIATDYPGNRLELFNDIPNLGDACDIDEPYRRAPVTTDTGEAVLSEVAGEPVVVVTKVVGDSPVVQQLSLPSGSRSLVIKTEIDWREEQRLLKLGFGFDLRADTSAAETQFGHFRRATHTNTSWDAGRAEVCAQRWLLVDEPDYGVAIANDSVYGHEVTRDVRQDGGTTTTVKLSLLRSPIHPDPRADRGRHEFTVAVRPNAGAAEAVEEGYFANLPVRTVRGAGSVEPLVTIDSPGIVVEAVKLAEDGSGDVIVRVYEALGRHTSGTLRTGFEPASVTTTDLLEHSSATPGVSPDPAGTNLELRPFQIVTLRFKTT